MSDPKLLGELRQAVLDDVANAESIYDTYLIYPDGHEIMPQSYYLERKAPKFYVDLVTFTQKSDGSAKGQLYDNKGNPVDELHGVYHLDWLDALCDLFEVKDYKAKIGRGFQAREYANALWRKFKGDNHE